MQVILKEDVEKLGTTGELVTVKDGYGRNYLIPRGKAVIATKGAIKAVETERAQSAEKIQMDLDAARELAEKLSSTSLTIPAKSGEEGKLFGTVTTQHIADALKEKGFVLDRRNISLEEDVKSLGEYQAEIAVMPDIKASVRIWVVREGEEQKE